MAEGQRLDAALAARGLARSRTHAAKLIADGLVTVDGKPVVKPAARVAPAQEIVVAGTDHYVSRAAHKLVAALDGFGVDPARRLALDVGASTGGFTQVLLERGAKHVIALDVGHGQLAPPVLGDRRVTLVEGENARDLTQPRLLELAGGTLPDLVVADVSFISLTQVLPALVRSTEADADFVLLVKPQFEVGRGGVREGIVRDAGLRADAVSGVLWAAWDLGAGTAGVLASPIIGASGNHEYLVHLRPGGGSNPGEWMARISEVIH
jgi:23S rRNA (cytidine1920-2'-O)/16S rRNA (cytidine1409-2'-O)-methyltransferase